MMSIKDEEIEELKERNQTCIKESDLTNAVSFLMNRNNMSDYISKDKIKEKIDLIDKEYAEFIEKNKNDLYLVNINAQRHNAMQLILEELLGESK